MLFLRIFVFAYGTLTLLAIGEQAFAGEFHWTHILYPIFSLCLMYIAIRPYPVEVLYVGLIGLLATAVIGGLLTNTFQWSHIAVRLILSIAMLFFWQK